MKDLPEFKHREKGQVEHLLSEVLTNLNQSSVTMLYKLISFDDGHYRALFNAGYFGPDTPSKSQWNTLKKKLKRHDRQIFVFKDHGETVVDGETYLYVDFGFFAN